MVDNTMLGVEAEHEGPPHECVREHGCGHACAISEDQAAGGRVSEENVAALFAIQAVDPALAAPWDAWWAAMRASPEYEKLGSGSFSDLGTLSYLRKPVELFARSFAQWVAVHSDDPGDEADDGRQSAIRSISRRT